MFKFTKLIYCLITLVIICNADDIGGFFLGVDIIPKPNYEITAAGQYSLYKQGIAFGFYIPISVPLLDIHLCVKASKHNIQGREWSMVNDNVIAEKYLYERHFAGLNELLIGKQFGKWKNFSLLPQLGIGLLVEGLYDADNTNVTSTIHHNMFLDPSLAIRYHFEKLGMFLRVGYLYSFYQSHEVYTATDRLSLTLGIFK